MLTVREAAEYLGVTQAALRIAIHEGRLPCQRDGRRVLLRRDALNLYRARLTARGDQKEACARASADALAGLEPRAAAFIALYAREGVTLGHIADAAGLTRERVRQVIEEGLRHIGG